MNTYIKSIKFIGENRPNRRKIKVLLSNNVTVTIEALYESWEQYGACERDLYITIPIAERYNDWLHGGDMQ